MHQEREQPGLKDPKKIVSDTNRLEITIPHQRQRVYLQILPDGTSLMRIENISLKEEKKITAEVDFTATIRNFITAYIEYTASGMVRSDGLWDELDLHDLKDQFDKQLDGLIGLAYSNKKIFDLIMGQGRQFTTGEEHMGIMPYVVRAPVEILKTRVIRAFSQKAQAFTRR